MPPKASTSTPTPINGAVSTSKTIKKSGSTSAIPASKKANAAGTSKSAVMGPPKTNGSEGMGSNYSSMNGSMVASTSSTTAPPVKMTSIEVALHNAILAAPKRTMSQTQVWELDDLPEDRTLIVNAINAMMRKHLLKPAKNAKGETVFIAVPKAEARELGAMDPEEKMVLDFITASANQGIWTRTLKAKTGLHQNVINRAIKVLEQKKMIKSIKSVKNPTRKIYMLEGMQPSIEVTGGPWYAGNDLDVEFIDTLQKVAAKFIRDKSYPNGRTDMIYPMAYVPYLPTAEDVLDYLVQKDIMSVDLNVEHIEAILNVLVYDGEIERIWARRYEEDGRQADFEIDITPPVTGQKSTKRKRGGATKAKKKRRRRDSANIDEDSDNNAEDDDEEDEDSDEASQDLDNTTSDNDGDYALPPRLMSHSSTDTGRGSTKPGHKRPGPAGNQWYWVYRTCLTSVGTNSTDADGNPTITYPQIYELGYTQTPCGVCPVSEFCYNRGQPKVLPLPGEQDLLNLDAGWEASKGPASSATINGKGKGNGNDATSLLKMKVPAGGGEAEDADGAWKGGGRVGGKVVAPVNPANCRYYSNWFGEDMEW